MSYIDHFLDPKKPLVKPKFVAVEEDWNFLCTIYPEPGFRSYYLGHIISKLANELKSHGIHSFFDRNKRPEFATVAGLLSSIQLTRPASLPDVGRGVECPRSEAAERAGEPPGDACFTRRQAEGYDNQSTRQETELELVRLVTSQFPFTAEDIKSALAAPTLLGANKVQSLGHTDPDKQK